MNTVDQNELSTYETYDYDDDYALLARLEFARREQHNRQVERTMNSLRNAEFFHTGQKEYMQQQMQVLMAKRY